MWEKSPFLCVPPQGGNTGSSLLAAPSPPHPHPEQGDGPARSVGGKERAGNGGKGGEVWGRILENERGAY